MRSENFDADRENNIYERLIVNSPRRPGEGHGGDRDGNDEGHKDSQPHGINRHGVAARVHQRLQDGDVVVELGEPECHGDRTIQRL